MGLGHEIDAAVPAPPPGPFVPTPHLAELAPIDWGVLQIPLAQPFEIVTELRALGIGADLCLNEFERACLSSHFTAINGIKGSESPRGDSGSTLGQTRSHYSAPPIK